MDQYYKDRISVSIRSDNFSLLRNKVKKVLTKPIRYSLSIICLLSFMSACDKTTPNDVLRAQKPNIVLILADDLGIGDVGAYRKGPIQTPHIDQLARNGVRFTQAYVTHPVC